MFTGEPALVSGSVSRITSGSLNVWNAARKSSTEEAVGLVGSGEALVVLGDGVAD
jgi:hypothetical protein